MIQTDWLDVASTWLAISLLISSFALILVLVVKKRRA